MNLKEGFVLPYLRNLKPPLYRRIIQKARSIEGVLTLLSGNPDFETPKHITEAAIEALKTGWTHYRARAKLRVLVTKNLKVLFTLSQTLEIRENFSRVL